MFVCLTPRFVSSLIDSDMLQTVGCDGLDIYQGLDSLVRSISSAPGFASTQTVDSSHDSPWIERCHGPQHSVEQEIGSRAPFQLTAIHSTLIFPLTSQLFTMASQQRATNSCSSVDRKEYLSKRTKTSDRSLTGSGSQTLTTSPPLHCSLAKTATRHNTVARSPKQKQPLSTRADG